MQKRIAGLSLMACCALLAADWPELAVQTGDEVALTNGVKIFVSTNLIAITAKQKSVQDVPVGFVTGREITKEDIDTAKQAGAEWLIPLFWKTTRESVSAAHKAGLKVAVKTNDTRTECRQARLLRCDAMITEHFDRVLKIVTRTRNPHRIPVGAASMGFTKCVINETGIRPEDVSPDRKGLYKWFSGRWYDRETPAAAKYVLDEDGVFTMLGGGDLSSVPPTYPDRGALPLLPGKDGFYVEYTVSLSDMDQDHASAFWLMPSERRRGNTADWFMEIDVDEAQFGPGLTGTVHNLWEAEGGGHIQNPNNVCRSKLDRTKPQTFGASYDPATRTVMWWWENYYQMQAGTPYVPAVAEGQNFYLILTAKMNKLRKPYKMHVHAVRAFVPASSSLEAVPYDPDE
jgi:hypothetical protein